MSLSHGCTAFVTWVIVALLAVSCANPGEDSGIGQAQAPQDPNHRPAAGPGGAPGTTPSAVPLGDWTEIFEQVTDCPHAPCSGIHGFGVTADGHYYVGPARAQALHEGTLSLIERAEIALATKEAFSDAPGAQRCTTGDPAPGSDTGYTLRVAFGAAPAVTLLDVTEQGRSVCIRGDAAKIRSLREGLEPALEHYDGPPAPPPSGRPSPHPSPDMYVDR
jgi:hypothetical protein